VVVAPESDTNVCGIINSLGLLVMLCLPDRGTAKFIQEGTYKYIPYCKLFRRVSRSGRIWSFEAYSNRDSLKYRSVYGLDDADLI
jgi:hypothetical protein